MSNDLHQATGSMPAQPEEEKIETPVEEEEETEINELSDDVPTEDVLDETAETPVEAPNEPENGSEVPEGENIPNEDLPAENEANPAPEQATESPLESEMDENGEEPVVEPINE